jgi:trans-aconitate methyltransferase
MNRTHDKFYLAEDIKKVKQSFCEVAEVIKFKKKITSIADVGCATGIFPDYLSKQFPETKIFGIEYLDVLLHKASDNFPDISFIKGDVLDRNSVSVKFDVITMLGVLSIFDDYHSVLTNTLSWLEPKGQLILHNMVSEYDVDVFVKYTPSSLKPDFEKLESGWNIISQKSLEMVAEANNAKVIYSKPFMLNVDLIKRDDVIRSWTETNISGHKDIFNALHIRQPQRIIVIEKL